LILPYLYVFLVFPVLVGILAVDLDGQPFSAIDYIGERLAGMNFEPPEQDEEEMQGMKDEGFINNTNSFAYPELVQLPDQIDDGLNTAWAFIWFLGSQSKDLGTWIGTSTAPFHYVIAFVIAVFALFINQTMWIIAFFYLLFTGEFKNIRKKDIV